MELTRTSELDAVNTILSIMGETPVNTLDVAGNLHVEQAQARLREYSRDIQERGWHFNTDQDYSMARNGANRIPVPDNVLHITTSGNHKHKYKVVERGGFLYDIEEQSFTFDEALLCRVVWFMEFDEIPEAARRYITIRAARALQERMVGAETTHKFTADDEAMALGSLNRAELRLRKANMLTGSWSVFQTIRNRRI
jgi:hypothetical protein